MSPTRCWLVHVFASGLEKRGALLTAWEDDETMPSKKKQIRKQARALRDSGKSRTREGALVALRAAKRQARAEASEVEVAPVVGEEARATQEQPRRKGRLNAWSSADLMRSFQDQQRKILGPGWELMENFRRQQEKLDPMRSIVEAVRPPSQLDSMMASVKAITKTPSWVDAARESFEKVAASSVANQAFEAAQSMRKLESSAMLAMNAGATFESAAMKALRSSAAFMVTTSPIETAMAEMVDLHRKLNPFAAMADIERKLSPLGTTLRDLENKLNPVGTMFERVEANIRALRDDDDDDDDAETADVE
jgi:hypothetical protein